jgi:hypothetical protein
LTFISYLLQSVLVQHQGALFHSTLGPWPHWQLGIIGFSTPLYWELPLNCSPRQKSSYTQFHLKTSSNSFNMSELPRNGSHTSVTSSGYGLLSSLIVTAFMLTWAEYPLIPRPTITFFSPSARFPMSQPGSTTFRITVTSELLLVRGLAWLSWQERWWRCTFNKLLIYAAYWIACPWLTGTAWASLGGDKSLGLGLYRGTGPLAAWIESTFWVYAGYSFTWITFGTYIHLLMVKPRTVSNFVGGKRSFTTSCMIYEL